MGQQNGRDAHVVVDDLSFSETHGGVHDLIKVAEAQLLALNLDFGARRHGSGISADAYMLPAGWPSGKSRPSSPQLSQHPSMSRHQRWGERPRQTPAREYICPSALPAGAGSPVPGGPAAAEREASPLRGFWRVRIARAHGNLARHQRP